MKGFFMQGVAVLFSQCPEVAELEALLDDYPVHALADDSSWPMGGPGFAIEYRPEVNGTCVVDVCDRAWPDDMGDPKSEPELFMAWSMGFFGPGAFPGGLGRAVQHSYPWPAAEDAVPRHRAFVRLRVSYIRGAGPEAKVAPPDYDAVAEFAWLARVARRLLDHPQALCFFNPNGEVLLDAENLEDALNRAAAAGQPPVEAAVNVRIWSVDEQWKLADTVGFAQFDQPDHEIAFRRGDHPIQEIAALPLNVGLYLLGKPGAIKTGHTVDGPGGKWRAQERDTPVLSPPRNLLHWTLDGGPTPPPSLHQTAPDTAPPPPPSNSHPPLDEIRRRAVAWLRGPEFAAVYEDVHVLWWMVALACLFKPFHIRGMLHGAAIRGYVSSARWKRYQRLPESGDVLLGHVVIGNTGMADNSATRVPCLALASFDPAALPVVARLAARMGELYTFDEPVEGEAPLAEIVRDDDYQFWRRSLLPPECTGGAEIYAFKLLACIDDLPPDSPEGAPFAFFAERGASGAAIVVPWKIATGDNSSKARPGGGPPPLPGKPPPIPGGPPPIPGGAPPLP